MSWSLRHQILYVVLLFLFFSVLGLLLVYSSLNEVPTCSDFKQNGDETGVDCGGSCVRACVFQADPLSIIWSRVFIVVPGRYNALAYLENHNKNFAVEKIKYSFRFADKDNIYLGKREGVAFIPPGRTFAIFERGIEFGTSVPVYTTFTFTEMPNWLRVSNDLINQAQILTGNINLENEITSPHLSVNLKNISLFSIPDINVIAILYDDKHNAVSVSSSYLDKLSGEEEKIVDFTWPLPFSDKIINKEILPIFNIFKVKIE